MISVQGHSTINRVFFNNQLCPRVVSDGQIVLAIAHIVFDELPPDGRTYWTGAYAVYMPREDGFNGGFIDNTDETLYYKYIRGYQDTSRLWQTYGGLVIDTIDDLWSTSAFNYSSNPGMPEVHLRLCPE